MTKPPASASDSMADSSTAVPSALPKTTKEAPEEPPLGSSPKAPTMRSARPSPFTSPAALTERPDSSAAETPLMTKPPASASDWMADSSTAVPSALPKTTKEAPE